MAALARGENVTPAVTAAVVHVCEASAPSLVHPYAWTLGRAAPGRPAAAAAAAAVGTLRSEFDVVGIFEHMEASLILFERRYGWDVDFCNVGFANARNRGAERAPLMTRDADRGNLNGGTFHVDAAKLGPAAAPIAEALAVDARIYAAALADFGDALRDVAADANYTFCPRKVDALVAARHSRKARNPRADCARCARAVLNATLAALPP